jgi:arabinogalactan oligomer/maltooligosaccharide transport system substrate-binding protein
LLHFGAAALIVSAFGFTSAHVSAASHTNAGTTPPKLKHGITLTIWDGLEDLERPVEQKIADQWAKATGNTVKIQTTADNKDKMCIGAPTGNAADIEEGPHNEVSVMQACGVLAPIPTWAWTPSQQKTYVPSAIKAAYLAGKPYSVPVLSETTGMFYNKSLVPASTFAPAKGQKYLTWAVLIPRLKKIAAAKGVQPFAWDPSNFYYDYAFISAYGGYVFKYNKKTGYDWRQLGLGNAAAVKAVSFIQSLSDHGKYKLVPDSMTMTVGDGLFTKGQLLVDWTGPWNEVNFTKANINYGFAPLPAIDSTHRMHPFATIQTYALSKYSKNFNEAASLVSYLASHLQVPDFKVSGRLPVIKSLLNAKAVQKDPVSAGLARVVATTAQPMPNIPEMSQVRTPAGTDIQLAFKGQASASAAAADMVSKIKAGIAKEHSG